MPCVFSRQHLFGDICRYSYVYIHQEIEHKETTRMIISLLDMFQQLTLLSFALVNANLQVFTQLHIQ